MVDTHAHIGLCRDGPETIVERAGAAGVRRILTVGLEEGSNREAIELAREHDAVWACVGRHPNGAGGFDARAQVDLAELVADPLVAAVGETGLDYYRDRAPRSDQLRAFRAQIEIANELAKPLVIHMRSGEGEGDDAVAETFALLAAVADGVTVILHCFSAEAERAREAGERGWYCSFAGNLTYPKAESLREAAAAVPEELLLVETDAPFLAPQPVRGKPNQPANVVATAERLAAVRGVAYEELEALVESNAARAFGW